MSIVSTQSGILSTLRSTLTDGDAKTLAAGGTVNSSFVHRDGRMVKREDAGHVVSYADVQKSLMEGNGSSAEMQAALLKQGMVDDADMMNLLMDEQITNSYFEIKATSGDAGTSAARLSEMLGGLQLEGQMEVMTIDGGGELASTVMTAGLPAAANIGALPQMLKDEGQHIAGLAEQAQRAAEAGPKDEYITTSTEAVVPGGKIKRGVVSEKRIDVAVVAGEAAGEEAKRAVAVKQRRKDVDGKVEVQQAVAIDFDLGGVASNPAPGPAALHQLDNGVPASADWEFPLPDSSESPLCRSLESTVVAESCFRNSDEASDHEDAANFALSDGSDEGDDGYATAFTLSVGPADECVDDFAEFALSVGPKSAGEAGAFDMALSVCESLSTDDKSGKDVSDLALSTGTNSAISDFALSVGTTAATGSLTAASATYQGDANISMASVTLTNIVKRRQQWQRTCDDAHTFCDFLLGGDAVQTFGEDVLDLVSASEGASESDYGNIGVVRVSIAAEKEEEEEEEAPANKRHISATAGPPSAPHEHMPAPRNATVPMKVKSEPLMPTAASTGVSNDTAKRVSAFLKRAQGGPKQHARHERPVIPLSPSPSTATSSRLAAFLAAARGRESMPPGPANKAAGRASPARGAGAQPPLTRMRQSAPKPHSPNRKLSESAVGSEASRTQQSPRAPITHTISGGKLGANPRSGHAKRGPGQRRQRQSRSTLETVLMETVIEEASGAASVGSVARYLAQLRAGAVK